MGWRRRAGYLLYTQHLTAICLLTLGHVYVEHSALFWLQECEVYKLLQTYHLCTWKKCSVMLLAIYGH